MKNGHIYSRNVWERVGWTCACMPTENNQCWTNRFILSSKKILRLIVPHISIVCALNFLTHAFWSKRGNIDTAAHFPWLHAMENVKSDIKRMVILDLISTLIMIAMELRQRLTGYESTSPRHDGLEERQRPSGRNFGGHQGDDLEEGLTETPCKGMCQFCGKSCIRLKPGHSNHKCHKHLHWR